MSPSGRALAPGGPWGLRLSGRPPVEDRSGNFWRSVGSLFRPLFCIRKSYNFVVIDFGALFGQKITPKSTTNVTKIDNEIYTDFDTFFVLFVLGFGAAQTSKTIILLL